MLCDPLDDARVKGVGVTARTPNATLPEALAGKYRDWRWCLTPSGKGNPRPPTIDRTIKASGSGALRFTIPSNSDANDSGYCSANFTPDNSVQFGEGETFFVQYRVRFSCEQLFMDCDPKSPAYKQERRRHRMIGEKPGNNSGAFKVSILGTGDHANLRAPTDSCSLLELVLNNGKPNGVVGGYHSCGWYAGYMEYYGLHRASGWGTYDTQPIGRRGTVENLRHCWNVDPATGRPSGHPWKECVLWWADEWMTVTQQVTIGQWARSPKDPRTSNYRLWVSRETGPPVLVFNHDLKLRAPEKPFLKYGKVWLLPYHTGKDPAETH
ncbi:MAG: hypothetical protein ACREF4_01450, partial [Gammaproteobacteria bacterium]